MKGPDISLKHLQTALTMELTTVNQYLLQAALLADWGVHRLAERMGEEIDEERGHADRFLERLIFLEGRPDMQSLDEIVQPDSVRSIFEKQLAMENEARRTYDRAARDCQEAGDVGSFELFMTILKDEEEHIDFVEEQLSLMAMMGEQLYIARQVASVAKTGHDDD
ncbi:MAG: bacterioferritin [Rhizobiales bacterium]|nr:bacterioferritin [Hyphomicrobiales bacterium]